MTGNVRFNESLRKLDIGIESGTDTTSPFLTWNLDAAAQS
jgi:hypothetical protein